MNVVLGDLPTWNLSDLYSSPAGADLGADLKRAAAEAEAFEKDYQGRIVGLDGKALGGAIVRLEVNRHNAAARRMYLAAGFRDEARDLLTRAAGAGA